MKAVVRVSDACNLCGLCAEYCPTGVFRISGSSLEVNEDACIYCRGCEVLCPTRAVSVRALDEGLSAVSRVKTLVSTKSLTCMR